MTTGLRLFISSCVFAIVIACAYWLIAREIAGTFLLGFMAFALTVIAGYMIVAERDADLWGDDAQAKMADAAGSDLGTYSIRSPLPFWAALTITSFMLGLVISPTLAVVEFIAILALGAAFISQSR